MILLHYTHGDDEVEQYGHVLTDRRAACFTYGCQLHQPLSQPNGSFTANQKCFSNAFGKVSPPGYFVSILSIRKTSAL